MSGEQSFFTTTPHDHKINVPLFVFHIDILLLSLFALYVAFTLPRALVRLFQPSEILNGFFLRSGTSPAPPERSGSTRILKQADKIGRSGTVTRSNSNTRSQPIRSTSTRTNHSTRTLVDVPEDANLPDPFPAIVTPCARGSHKSRAPTRVPRWTTIIHPTFAYALNFRVFPGFTLGKFLVLLTYGVIMLYASLFSSSPFTDPVRTGYVAMSQIPIVMALAGKTNWLSWVCGVGYEKLNYIHRFSGRVVVIAANIHALGYLYKWSLHGVMRTQLDDPKYRWGLVALSAVDLLFACTLSFVQNRMYALFFRIHVIGVIVFLLATYMHFHTTLPYILTAVGLYVFDHLARIARTRYTTAWLTAEHSLNGGTTLVHVPSLDAGWRAGQHVRIRIVSDAWFGWWATWLVGRARPFTIAAASESGGMMLPIKAQGAWTRDLLRMASDAADARPAEKSPDTERGRGPTREVRIIVEGPYSGPGYTLYTAYSGAVLVAGGSGISYAMSVLGDMLQKHACGKSRVRIIEVIWSVADPDSLYSLLPELTSLMQPRASPHTPLSLRLTVHWTRASSHPPRVPRMTLPSGVHLCAGRPDIYATLQSVVAGVRTAYSASRSSSSDTPSGIVVGSCGPTSLIDDASRAVGRVSWADWKDVGGVESIEEYVFFPLPYVPYHHWL
ncbi:ferric reductase like transmembrane component-domain-containing protein [Multifurca ochricompacta]|uniref:Ferric reductase like transmembrane component-domain-containing protein n=1 Tax=Multifurca ochricompacta TaxID=376703 RepID=A0AAD4QKJ1_9AGAM|nr:ferric reductase like transmembrane component-domain-containing protein [Multifurca ochricompacta]